MKRKTKLKRDIYTEEFVETSDEDAYEKYMNSLIDYTTDVDEIDMKLELEHFRAKQVIDKKIMYHRIGEECSHLFVHPFPVLKSRHVSMTISKFMESKKKKEIFRQCSNSTRAWYKVLLMEERHPTKM